MPKRRFEPKFLGRCGKGEDSGEPAATLEHGSLDRGDQAGRRSEQVCRDVDDEPTCSGELVQSVAVAAQLLSQRVPGAVVFDGDTQLEDREVDPGDGTTAVRHQMLWHDVEARLDQQDPSLGLRLRLRPGIEQLSGSTDVPDVVLAPVEKPRLQCGLLDQTGSRHRVQPGDGSRQRVPGREVERHAVHICQRDVVHDLDPGQWSARPPDPHTGPRSDLGAGRNACLDGIAGPGKLDPAHGRSGGSGDGSAVGEHHRHAAALQLMGEWYPARPVHALNDAAHQGATQLVESENAFGNGVTAAEDVGKVVDTSGSVRHAGSLTSAIPRRPPVPVNLWTT